MTDTNELREKLAKELISLPVGDNKPLCWDVEILLDFITAQTQAAYKQGYIDGGIEQLTKGEVK